jgi:hypothetical protein
VEKKSTKTQGMKPIKFTMKSKSEEKRKEGERYIERKRNWLQKSTLQKLIATRQKM